MADIVVIGSLNMDLSVVVPRIPSPGETLIGGTMVTTPGGKGANQAGACAKLGKQVTMIGKVGNDDFGRLIVKNLESLGVDSSRILTDTHVSSGTAMIMVDSKGENCIVVTPGANRNLSVVDVHEVEDVIRNARIVIMQLEIPLDTVLESIRIARKNNIPVLLNPAPAVELPDEIYQGLDFLIPNETEVKLLTGVEIEDEQSIIKASTILLNKGVRNVVITLGKNGAYAANGSVSAWIPSLAINPVDTTAAGDAFIGGFAAAQIESFSLKESVRFACCAGALAATKHGAQTSLPSLQEVKAVYRPEGGVEKN